MECDSIARRGGSKKRQQHDIDAAGANWQDYKRRKKEDNHGADT